MIDALQHNPRANARRVQPDRDALTPGLAVLSFGAPSVLQLCADEVSRIPVPDGRLMSVQLRIADGLLHIADEFPTGVLARPRLAARPLCWPLEVADAEAVFAQVEAAIRQPLADMFWGDRHGLLEDPLGIAGTSLSTCATCHTMRSSPPPHRRSPECTTDRGTSGLR